MADLDAVGTGLSVQDLQRLVVRPGEALVVRARESLSEELFLSHGRSWAGWQPGDRHGV